MADKIIAKDIVVKVQIPLSGYPQVLIYNEDQTYKGVFEYTYQLKRELREHMGKKVKAYLVANVIEDDQGNCIFELNSLAKNQDPGW